ncbi:heterokaryon incompatibility, partial [Zopfia rhizophila CBS 207.26]
VPSTIRHTMQLVRLLGIRYLWIDSFYIVHYDEEGKAVEVRNMGWIYRNAYVTIIAANGPDANHGLREIRGVTAL